MRSKLSEFRFAKFPKDLFSVQKLGFLLFILVGFSCSNNTNSIENDSEIKTDSAQVEVIPEEKSEAKINGETLSLDEFGMAFTVPNNLAFLQKNNQFVSALVPIGGNAESGEFVIITPTVETGNSFSSQMQQSGFEIGTDTHNNLTASISDAQAGIAMNATFVQSPEGGGLLVMYALKDGVNPTISEEDLQNIIQSVSHFTPTWSLENRIAFYQQKQQLNDQQKLAKMRADHKKNQLDMLGLQVEGLIGR
jgi:hypothetical protein